MAYYQRTNEGPMEFEYENSPILSFNSFLCNRIDSSSAQANSPCDEPGTPQESTTDATDLFLPKSYFNTNLQSALDQNMSTQLGGISLKETITTNPGLDGEEHQELDQKTMDDVQPPEQSNNTAIVPYQQPTSAPSTPSLSFSPINDAAYNNDTQRNSNEDNNSRNAPVQCREQQHDIHNPATAMSPEQHQAYYPHLYPMASYYHHDPVAHRKSFLTYIGGLIRIGCQLVLFSIGLYIGLRFIFALNEDVASKIQIYESEYMERYFICEQEYHRNQCQNNHRPAMVEPCREWLRCLYTPAWIGKTKVLAETFAEIANGFVDTISLKAMGFGILLVITTLLFSNQGKHAAGQHQQQYNPPPPPPPLPPNYFTQHFSPSSHTHA